MPTARRFREPKKRIESRTLVKPLGARSGRISLVIAWIAIRSVDITNMAMADTLRIVKGT
jgi:hypothetical protein